MKRGSDMTTDNTSFVRRQKNKWGYSIKVAPYLIIVF